MRACGAVPDEIRHILRLYRSVEQFCPVCAFEACGGGRDYDIRTYMYAIVELGSILESGHDLGLFTHALAPYNRLV